MSDDASTDQAPEVSRDNALVSSGIVIRSNILHCCQNYMSVDPHNHPSLKETFKLSMWIPKEQGL